MASTRQQTVEVDRTGARVADDAAATDVALSVPTPKQKRHPSGERVSALTSYTTIDGAWHATLSQTNTLSSGSAMFPRDVDLRLGSGRLAEDLRSLEPIRMLRLDVMTQGQLALHLPVPYSVPAASPSVRNSQSGGTR